MKKILIPIKSKLKPKEVDDEINKFKEIHKSPYSQTYYDTKDITWEHKPEGSLRISDHWNFESRGEKHCILENTEEYIDDNWILAKYINGRYHVIKEFGKGIDGYLYTTLYENQLLLLKKLYSMGQIEKSHEWYKKHTIKPPFTREGYMNNVENLSKYLLKDKVVEYKNKKPKVNKIIFIEDKYIQVLKNSFSILDESENIKKLIKENNLEDNEVYELNYNKEQSFEEIYTLVLEDNKAIDFKF